MKDYLFTIWFTFGKRTIYAASPQEAAIKAMAEQVGRGREWKITILINEETGQTYKVDFGVKEAARERR